MAFEPDILVRDRDGGTLMFLVEAKWKPLDAYDLARSESMLRDYMRAVRCGLAALVSPTQFRIYRDSFRSYRPESIELVFDYDLSSAAVFSREALSDPMAFENELQTWIEGLRDESNRSRLPPSVRTAVETYVLPVLWHGEVRAAHHRYGAMRASERRRGP